MTTEQFRVTAVSCDHCVRAITNEVATLKGIDSVRVALDSKIVTVTHDNQVTTDAIIAAIVEAGYEQVETLA